MSKMRTPRNTRLGRPAVCVLQSTRRGRRLHRHEQQVAVDRDVALATRTEDLRAQHRRSRVVDIVDLEAVVVAVDRVVAEEGEVGVDAGDGRRERRRRQQVHVARRFAGVVKARRQTDSRGRPRRRRTPRWWPITLTPSVIAPARASARLRQLARWGVGDIALPLLGFDSMRPARVGLSQWKGGPLRSGGTYSGESIGICPGFARVSCTEWDSKLVERGRSVRASVVSVSILLTLSFGLTACTVAEDAAPVPVSTAPIVQPGAPGEPNRTLSPEDVAAIEPAGHTEADAVFVRDMLHHHEQALKMTGMVVERTDDRRRAAARRAYGDRSARGDRDSREVAAGARRAAADRGSQATPECRDFSPPSRWPSSRRRAARTSTGSSSTT